jgi:hypothetical protein
MRGPRRRAAANMDKNKISRNRGRKKAFILVILPPPSKILPKD